MSEANASVNVAAASRRTDRIPVAGPWITEREVDAITHAATSAWYDCANDEIDRFERNFALATNRAHAIALPSCTSGLHLALLALGIGPGDEVIVPETTWIATAAPIVYCGATPIFADVDADHWCLDLASFEALITPRTRAVIPVDLYGGFPQTEAIEQMAERHGFAVVEDAAQCAGGSHQSRAAGNFGVAATFSFHGSKTLTTGEGGMVLCDDDALWERMRFLRDHGRLPGDVSFRSVEVAWKYKMSSLQAALGRVQLERIDELVAKKREILGWYQDLLAGQPMRLNAERNGDRCTFWMVTAVLDQDVGVAPHEIAAALEKADIASRPFFPPLSSLPAFGDATDAARAQKQNCVAADLAGRALNLPSALVLERPDIERVCEVVAASVA